MTPTTLTHALVAATLLATVSAGAALAHDTRGIDRTQAEQLAAIADGRRTGSLTRREYESLVAEQARIAEMERRAKADGRVTGREHRALRDAQRAAGEHIVDDSTNRRVNFWRRLVSKHTR